MPDTAMHHAGAAQPEQAEGYADAGRWWILATCSLVAFAQLVEPQLWMIGYSIPPSAFGAAWGDYRLIANIGVVIFIAFQLIGGVLADMFGRRRILLIGAIGATVGNMLSLVADTVPAMVATRGLVGAMGALAFPLTLGLIRLSFAGDERKLALLIFTFANALGVLARLLAIPIEDRFGWRWALLLPIACGVAGAALAWRTIPESRAPGGVGRGEAVASAAWTMVFLAIVFGFAVAQSSGTWRNPLTLTAGGAGLAGFIVMTVWSRSSRTPELFQRAEHVPRSLLTILLLVTATLNFALTGYILQLYGFFFHVKQYGGLLSGVALAPTVLANLLWMRWAARFAVERPTQQVVSVGMVAVAAALALSGLMGPELPYLFFVPVMALFGLGFLLASTAWAFFFFNALPGDMACVNAGINRAAGLVGGAIAGAVLSVVLQAAGMAEFMRRLAELGLNEARQQQAVAALDAALQAGPLLGEEAESLQELGRLALLAIYRDAYNAGVTAALLTAAAVTVAVGLIAWAWMRWAGRALREG
jgi:MFS transporter, DHA2 family, multidrug resistance protein